jgi:hypothetical protein
LFHALRINGAVFVNPLAGWISRNSEKVESVEGNGVEVIAFDPRVFAGVEGARERGIPLDTTVEGLNCLWLCCASWYNDAKTWRRCREDNDRPSLDHFRRRESSDAVFHCSSEVAAKD